MKKTLRVIAFLAIAGGLFPSSLYAQSTSKSFSVSVTIPERLELAAPSRIRTLESDPGALLMRISDFRSGRATNLGNKVDSCFVQREVGGRAMRVFTLTAI